MKFVLYYKKKGFLANDIYKFSQVIEKFVAKQEAKVNETTENDAKSEDRSKSGSENGSNSGSEDDEEDEEDSESDDDDDLELATIESLVSDHEENKNSDAASEIDCVPISNGFTVVKCSSTSENKFISDTSVLSHPRKRERCFDESKTNAAKRRVVVEKFIEEEIIILSD